MLILNFYKLMTEILKVEFELLQIPQPSDGLIILYTHKEHQYLKKKCNKS